MGMALLIKTGSKKDLPKEPKNWPKCGNFAFDDSSDQNQNILSTLFQNIISNILKHLF
jgi:hypothetical protein